MRASATGPVDEPALVGAEHLGDLAGDDVHQRGGRRVSLGHQPRRAEDAVEVAGPAGGAGLLPVAPQGDLGDREADHHEQDRWPRGRRSP